MDRRRFLSRLAASLAVPGIVTRRSPGVPVPVPVPGSGAVPEVGEGPAVPDGPGGATSLTLFLAGDVMTGRGIDQVLPHPVDPRLHEPYVKSAVRYVELAEAESGPIPEPVAFDYIWGDALAELERVGPDARVINLETAVTTAGAPWPGKGIHYRMHPGNTPVLTAAGVDVCVLGNNHVMDWGRPGLEETLRSVRGAGIAAPGAGVDLVDAARPAVVETERGRLLVFSYATPGAGVPRGWAASETEPGVNLLDLGPRSADRVIGQVEEHRQAGDRVVVSIHWGGNWGYAVPREQRAFAHRLIDAGAADIIHGHSSHHPKGIEVHQGRTILYGVGDLLNDYEGIGGREAFRGELTLLYLPTLRPSGELATLRMAPLRIRRFRLERVSDAGADWMARTLTRHSRELGTRVERTDEGLELRWG